MRYIHNSTTRRWLRFYDRLNVLCCDTAHIEDYNVALLSSYKLAAHICTDLCQSCGSL